MYVVWLTVEDCDSEHEDYGPHFCISEYALGRKINQLVDKYKLPSKSDLNVFQIQTTNLHQKMVAWDLKDTKGKLSGVNRYARQVEEHANAQVAKNKKLGEQVKKLKQEIEDLKAEIRLSKKKQPEDKPPASKAVGRRRSNGTEES